MTRPEIIRADSIDLQDPDAPSAKDHLRLRVPTEQNTASSSVSFAARSPADSLYNNHVSPHQAETLREVAAETAEERRVSWNGADFNDAHLYIPDSAAGIAEPRNPVQRLQLRSSPGGVHQINMAAASEQDDPVVAQNGGSSSADVEEDVDDGDEGLDDDDDDDDDDDMDKISSSPSIEDEDIDFEFVYALHTFVATVEGQANATKGDTMVLLDDSNSYWWLVRVVKDSSIGYLPAEHIETPTERLARLNKHRNIDLSATMLGDQAEKVKNPIRTAMRRRKAKNVTFAAPTYVDYSEIEYSTDEDELEAEYFSQKQQVQQHQGDADQKQGQKHAAALQATDDDEDDDTAKVEPLKPRAPKENGAGADARQEDANGDANGGKGLTRTSEEIFVASKSETPGPTKTKDGTVRDSFFKDDTVETKKITLTPNLLRDDSAPRTSSEKESKVRVSLDRLEKDINSVLVKDDKKKKDKKEKEKKPGAFRSLFSRKDKKRNEYEEDDSSGKRSMDTASIEKDYDDTDEQSSPGSTASPQRQPSKLQKANPMGQAAETSPTRRPSVNSSGQKETGRAAASSIGFFDAAPDGRPNNVDHVPPATMRLIEPENEREISQESISSVRAPASASSKMTASAAATKAEDSRPPMVTKASSRAALDEFDSDEEDVAAPASQRQGPVPEETTRQQQQPQKQVASAAATNNNSPEAERAGNRSAMQLERLSESPVQVSPVHSNNPPALMVDTSSQDGRSSPISSPSPELIEADDGSATHHAQDSITTSTSATTANTATWNDDNLRAFFDSGTDIRDLLVVVYDKTDVAPAGSDHPVVGSLFREQTAKLAEITSQLDNMLGDWLARKQRLRGSV